MSDFVRFIMKKQVHLVFLNPSRCIIVLVVGLVGTYLLFYENIPILECDLEQLFEIKLIYQIFGFEPDSKKAAEFIIELYKWGITQHEAFEKILENFSATEILMILRTGQLNDIK